MALINRVGDYLWSYIAPRKTQQRRDKPYKPPATAHRTPLSTAAAVGGWRQRHGRGTSPNPNDNNADTTSPRPPASANDALGGRSPSSGRSASRVTGASPLPVPDDDDDEYDANESTLVMTEHDYANERLERLEHRDTFDVEAYRDRLRQVEAELTEKGWAGDAISLFLKLEARGKEPLLPKPWELEFETLPAALFTPDGFTPHIGSLTQSGDFRASLALKELIKLGPHVRDADLTADGGDASRKPGRTPPESITKRAVGEYLKWAYADAKLGVSSPGSRKSLDHALAAGKSLPLLVNVAGPRTMSGADLQAVTLDRLVKLGEQWKAALGAGDGGGGYLTELPTLYGVISTYTVLGFVAYDIDYVGDDGEPEQPFLRTIAIFDFSQAGYDVWNSLAIALLGIHVRNEMVDIRDDIQAVRGPEYGVVPDEDEDA